MLMHSVHARCRVELYVRGHAGLAPDDERTARAAGSGMAHRDTLPLPTADLAMRFRQSISLPAADAAQQQPPRIRLTRTVTEGRARLAAEAAAAAASSDEEGPLHSGQHATSLEKIQVLHAFCSVSIALLSLQIDSAQDLVPANHSYGQNHGVFECTF